MSRSPQGRWPALPVPSFPWFVPQGSSPRAIDFGSGAPECYKATVNESETINHARLGYVGSRQQAKPAARRLLGFALFIERS
jgi:hypothetical protein